MNSIVNKDIHMSKKKRDALQVCIIKHMVEHQ